MSPTLSVAASLSPNERQDIGIQVLSRSQPISHLANQHQVSRKFVYQQGDKAQQALNESFAPSKGDDDVLFHWLPDDDGIPSENVTPNGEVWSLPDDEDMDDGAYFEMCSRAYTGIKLGGAPAWVQDQGEAPSPGWRFVAQFGEQYTLEKKPSATDPITLDLMQRGHIRVSRRLREGDDDKPRGEWQWIEDGTWGFTGPNLGCGLGYIFVQPLESNPNGWFFWQC